jgi:hypothetical protein
LACELGRRYEAEPEHERVAVEAAALADGPPRAIDRRQANAGDRDLALDGDRQRRQQHRDAGAAEAEERPGELADAQRGAAEPRKVCERLPHRRARLGERDRRDIRACCEQLVGDDEEERMCAGEDEPTARQQLLTLRERLHRARGHHTGECPTGKRDREVVRPGSEEQLPAPELRESIGAGEEELDSVGVGVEHSARGGAVQPPNVALLRKPCEQVLPDVVGARSQVSAHVEARGRLPVDLAAGQGLLVDDDDARPGVRQLESRRETAGACTDDRDVSGLHRLPT